MMTSSDLPSKAHKAESLGATLVEYVLLVALIAVIAMASVSLFGQTVSQRYSMVTSSLEGV